MILSFYLRYSTRFGQQISVILDNFNSGKSDRHKTIPLNYISDDYWGGSVELARKASSIRYYYVVEDNQANSRIIDGEKDRLVKLSDFGSDDRLTIVDTWNETGDTRNVFFTKAFENLFQRKRGISGKAAAAPEFNHEFRVKTGLMKPTETVCLLGSTSHLRNWDTASPVVMEREGNWFVTRLRLGAHEWPAAYKYGVYDTAKQQFVRFEEGENRILRKWNINEERIVLHDGFVRIPEVFWRGVGVNVPVFSLRSKQSFGTGDFLDLKQLVNWCRQTGINLIQLLPVNDTTARGNQNDSYPYAAISSFALHPLYINLQAVAGKQYDDIIKKAAAKQRRLNGIKQMDYELVIRYKRSAMRELYLLQSEQFARDKNFLSFFKSNRHWLVPYAAFCYLKNKNKTADFLKWKNYSNYDREAIEKLVSPEQKHYHKVAVYYFEQYHLHRQLKEVVDYAHDHNVILKGDLPIGIYRYSSDAWIHPELYNLEEQAGAPPDDFSPAGQNWGFPTYNWGEMQKTGFEWWRDRFAQLGKYFDAFRIDHILGFFRIWSIPYEQIDGTMGRFVPALPVDISEFERASIFFDYNRYCKPFITDAIVEGIFGDHAQQIIASFLLDEGEGRYALRQEVCTQRRALQYLEDNDMTGFRAGLFELISNVILFEEKGSGQKRFHFRINVADTSSFQSLDIYTKNQLKWLYNNYFYDRQEHYWEEQAMQKLPQLKRSTAMLVCGEDLGMVPRCVPEVMQRLGILGLNVQRMADRQHANFLNLQDVKYLSIVQPSTHDMSPLRAWWEEDPGRTQLFYDEILRQHGDAPANCTPGIVRQIIGQHIQSPAMWSIFQLQDLLALTGKLRVKDPADERINIPADPNHYWRYRMKGNMEDLIKYDALNREIKELIREGGRLHSN